MKRFDYEVAVNQLKLGKDVVLNKAIATDKIPRWANTEDFVKLFLPYLQIVGDSREQDNWIEKACDYYGISFVKAQKGKQSENLKEGDYTFRVIFGNRTFDYVGIVAFVRKGSICELYNNCIGKDGKERERIQRELNRFIDKHYRKVVLLLEFGENLTDLIGITFQFRSKGGRIETKDVKNVVYSAIMSWRQPNNKNFDVLQSHNRIKLFWLFLQDCYYFFRGEIRKECQLQNLIEEN